MKRKFFILPLIALLIAACTCAEPAEAAGKKGNMTVATYNIRVANRTDSVAGNGWGQRLPHVANLIRRHGFEIFGTQEGVRHALDSICNRLPGYRYIGVGRDNGAELGEHSAIFYHTGKFDLLDHGNFWLSETPDVPSFGWDAVCRRVCTWGKFRHKPTGVTFVYFNLHMDHKGTRARTESCRLILDRIKAFPEPLPVILSGDFNIDQTNESYTLLQNSGVMKDSYTTARKRSPVTSTFNNYKPSYSPAASNGEPARIDHIFLSPQFTVDSYSILTDTYTTPDGAPHTPSDHYPVAVTLSFPRR